MRECRHTKKLTSLSKSIRHAVAQEERIENKQFLAGIAGALTATLLLLVAVQIIFLPTFAMAA